MEYHIVWERTETTTTRVLRGVVPAATTTARTVSQSRGGGGRPRRPKRLRHRPSRHPRLLGAGGAAAPLALTVLLALPAAVSTAFALPKGRAVALARFNVRDEGSSFTNLRYKGPATVDMDVPPVRPEPLVKHPLFYDKNVHTESFPLPSPNPWEGIVPHVDVLASLLGTGGTAQMRGGVIGSDVTVRFADPREGADELVRGCGMSPDADGDAPGAALHLAEVLSFFRDVTSHGCEAGAPRMCKARIVATRGPVGTKCPRWHLDHVPVRLVMSLVGPGCVYVPETVDADGRAHDAIPVNREALNGLDMDDTKRANRIIIPREEGALHAMAGEAVLLMGREWEDLCQGHEGCVGEGHVFAAAHKSPTLGPFEGRVLLVVDVVPDDDFRE